MKWGGFAGFVVCGRQIAAPTMLQQGWMGIVGAIVKSAEMWEYGARHIRAGATQMGG